VAHGGSLQADSQSQARDLQPVDRPPDSHFRVFMSFTVSIPIFGTSKFAVIIDQMTDPANIWEPESPLFSMTTLHISLHRLALFYTFYILFGTHPKFAYPMDRKAQYPI
jgi:hypothetical protein